VLFGGFVVWLFVIGIRSLGSIAEAQVQSRAAGGAFRTEENHLQPGYVAATPNIEPSSLIVSLARLKNSVELGAVGQAVKSVDAVPNSSYQTLGKAGQVLSNPSSAQRFLSYPGAKDLTEHPKIVALRNDPEIMKMISQGQLMDLLHDQRLIDAANDPTLVEQVKKFELQQALEYATQRD
jgi:hypothetical protein